MTTVYGWRERVLPAAPALAPRGLWSGYSVDATLATLHRIPAKRDREREGERVPEERIIRSPFAPPHLVSLFATSFPRPLVCIYIYIYIFGLFDNRNNSDLPWKWKYAICHRIIYGDEGGTRIVAFPLTWSIFKLAKGGEKGEEDMQGIRESWKISVPLPLFP